MAYIGMWDRRGVRNIAFGFALWPFLIVLCTWKRPIEGFGSDSLGNVHMGFSRYHIQTARISLITYSLHTVWPPYFPFLSIIPFGIKGQICARKMICSLLQASGPSD